MNQVLKTSTVIFLISNILLGIVGENVSALDFSFNKTFNQSVKAANNHSNVLPFLITFEEDVDSEEELYSKKGLNQSLSLFYTNFIPSNSPQFQLTWVAQVNYLKQLFKLFCDFRI